MTYLVYMYIFAREITDLISLLELEIFFTHIRSLHVVCFGFASENHLLFSLIIPFKHMLALWQKRLNL